MKKLTLYRVRALLCLFFRRHLPRLSRNKHHYTAHARQADHHLAFELNSFFAHHSPQKVKFLSLISFQCWSLQEGVVRGGVTDEEYATFLDSLNELMAGLYRYHNSHSKVALRRPGPLIDAPDSTTAL